VISHLSGIWTLPRSRRSVVRRRSLSAAALLALGGAFAAGCGAGFNAESLGVRPNTGTAQVGSLKVNNVWVVVDPATGNAEIIGAVANTGTSADQLVSAKAGGLPATVRPAAPAVVSVSAALPNPGISVRGDTVSIASGAAVSFGRAGRPELEIPASSFSPGRITRVDLDFAHAGSTTVTAQIMPNTGLFKEYDPNGVNPGGAATVGASVSATPSGKAAASAKPSASANRSASAGASGSATPPASRSASASPSHS